MMRLASLIHGFTDRLPSHRCCGKRWNDLPRHRSFAHGEEVVIPEQCDDVEVESLGAKRKRWPPTVPCFCGAPATHWVYQVMGDGQTINGLAVCQKHQVEQT